MSYQVFWAEDALAGLTRLWLLAGNRQLLTTQISAIDRILAADPLAASIPGREGLRCLVFESLALTIVIDESQRTVEVVGLGLLK